MTPSEVYTTIRNQISEESPDFWGETEVYNLLWNAEKILAAKLQCVELIATDNTVASQREYDRPTGAQSISRLTYDRTKLKKITFTDVDKIEGDTEDFSDPEYYYEWGSEIGLVPTPIEAKELKYYYNGVPTQLTSSSTTFSIPNEFSHYLIDYVLFHMYMKDQQVSEADRHRAIWENNLKQANNEWRGRKSDDLIFIVRDEESYPFTDLGMI